MYNETLKKLGALLALEYNCTADDFFKADNILTKAALKDGSRNFSDKAPFLSIVTLGKNTVITADEVLQYFDDSLKLRSVEADG